MPMQIIKQKIKQITKQHFISLVLVLGCVLFTASSLQAQSLNSSIQAQTKINTDAKRSQQKISNLASQTQNLLNDFRKVVNETNGLKVYNKQLEKVVADQRNEKQSITNQLAGLEATNRGVTPLMIDMVDMFDKIVESDIPFHLEQRRERVVKLKAMLDRADVTTSEKYRRVMENYVAELEYGRTTEAYRGQLEDGTVVDFLRVGRTMLLYQSSDLKRTGRYNLETRAFEDLSDDYRLEIKEGLSIAKNEKAPDLVPLPVSAPESAR
ncbi:MAG: DUF3450 domain-containing protein [Xanthomonadales bacterium]|nr:DUF3450 domain-containing protein [Xanthomonadales bacterium]